MVDSANGPAWFTKMVGLHESGSSHTFCLHFNVHDYMPMSGTDMRINQWMINELKSRYDLVITCDVVNGISIESNEYEGPGGQPNTQKQSEDARKLSGLAQESKIAFPPTNPEEMLILIEAILRHPEKIRENEQIKIAVVMGFAETFFAESPNQEANKNVIRLIKWARESSLCRHLIALYTLNFAQLSIKIRNSASEIENIRIPLPDTTERLQFIKNFTLPENSESPEELARQANGLALSELKDVIKMALYERAPLTTDRIWGRKTELLSSATAGLLNIIRPCWDESCVGGLGNIWQALNPLIDAVKAGNILAVPMGILFMGPPGTGKSLIAEVLASKLGYSMVEFANIKNMWVGSSEANMALALQYLESQAPVVVFEDEFDQAETQRSSVQGLDAGVSEALRSMKMKFMARSDLRGKVIWIGATNRPDLIDAAFLRPGRFDLRIPFLPPSTDDERMQIYRAIMNKMKRIYPPFEQVITEDQLKVIATRSIFANKRLIRDGMPEVYVSIAQTLTGAEIELICHRAWQLGRSGTLSADDIGLALEDFFPDRPDDYWRMLDTTFKYINFKSLLPEKYRELYFNTNIGV